MESGDKYEQAIQGLFTAGTSGFRDLHKADEGRRKEKVGCKRGIEFADRCRYTKTVCLESVSYPMV
jgi:hypothetical protein